MKYIDKIFKKFIEKQYNYWFPKQNNNLEDYYNNKYPKSNITYKRKGLKTIKIDVRQFLNKNNFKLPTLTGNEDEIALNGLKWVIKNIKYTSDKKQFKIPEYWSLGFETFEYKKGDCEDGAILLYDILRKNGIPTWKLRLSAGWVKYNNEKVGHAYLTYYSENNNKWVLLDWCYYPNIKKIKERKDYKDEKNYLSTWWSFNEQYSWGDEGDIRNIKSMEILNL